MSGRCLPPIVVRLGKAERRHLDQLREGSGPLVPDLREVERLLKERLPASRDRRIVVPIVVVYERS